jgi:hypothetical protein
MMYIYIGPLQILKVLLQHERIVCERMMDPVRDEARFFGTCVDDIECMSVFHLGDGQGQSQDNLGPT